METKASTRWRKRAVIGIGICVSLGVLLWQSKSVRSLFDIHVILTPHFDGRWNVDGREVSFSVSVWNCTARSIVTYKTYASWDDLSYELTDTSTGIIKMLHPIYLRNAGGTKLVAQPVTIPAFGSCESEFGPKFDGSYFTNKPPSGHYEIVAIFRHGDRVYRSRPVPIEIVRR